MLEEYLSQFDESIFYDTFFESIARIESESTVSTGEKSDSNYKAIALIDLIRTYPTQNRKEFVDAWAKALNRFEHDFLNNFGNPDGSIDWEKLLRYNSGKDNVPWVTKVIPVTSAEDQEDESNEDEIGDVDDGIEDYTLVVAIFPLTGWKKGLYCNSDGNRKLLQIGNADIEGADTKQFCAALCVSV